MYEVWAGAVVTWTRLDDDAWANPKIIAAGNEAGCAYFRALSYCGCYETDGRIPEEIARFVANGRTKTLTRLIDVGLLERNGSGYVIPDYLEFNPSREKLRAKRANDRARKSEGNP